MIRRALLGGLAASLLGAWLIGNPAPLGYAGPGDYAAFTVWYGLRAYSAAVAAPGTQAAVDLRRVSDNATCTALIATDGSLDLTVGTPCNGSTQTVTAWVGASTAKVSKFYDQVAGNACGGASCDLVQATAGNQPTLFLTGGGGDGTKPYLHVVNQTSGQLEGANNFTPNAAKLMSFSVVGIRDSGTNTATLLTSNNVANNAFVTGAANIWSSNVAGAAADSVWHAANASKNEVAGGSVVNIDGVETTGTGTVSTVAGHPIALDTIGTLVGLGIGEGGFADNTNWSSGARAALCHNQRLYWATGGSC